MQMLTFLLDCDPDLTYCHGLTGLIEFFFCFFFFSVDVPVTESDDQKGNQVHLPSSPVAKTLHSQCRGPRFDSWSGN